jgi:tetratricopeptide (TPR) repeat protein
MRLSRRRRHHYVPALRAAALCAWRRGARRHANKLFERSLLVANQIESPLQEAEAHEAWGRCLLDGGDRGPARAHLERAVAIYEEAGAAPLASRARATLARSAAVSSTTKPNNRRGTQRHHQSGL